jgi:hypothetical protein
MDSVHAGFTTGTANTKTATTGNSNDTKRTKTATS